MTWGIEVAGVRVGYDAAPVLDGVSLRVGVGEWVSILGPNGSGKTTLLRTIGAFLRPPAGEVRVQGRPASAYARK